MQTAGLAFMNVFRELMTCSGTFEEDNNRLLGMAPPGARMIGRTTALSESTEPAGLVGEHFGQVQLLSLEQVLFGPLAVWTRFRPEPGWGLRQTPR